jgi:hypothetical protein
MYGQEKQSSLWFSLHRSFASQSWALGRIFSVSFLPPSHFLNRKWFGSGVYPVSTSMQSN